MKQPPTCSSLFQQNLESYMTYVNSFKASSQWTKYESAYSIYLWYLSNHSIERLHDKFANLIPKLFMHFNWEILLQNEIEKTSKKLRKLFKEREFDINPTFHHYLNENILVNAQSVIGFETNIEDFEKSLKQKDSFGSFCNSSDVEDNFTMILQQITDETSGRLKYEVFILVVGNLLKASKNNFVENEQEDNSENDTFTNDSLDDITFPKKLPLLSEVEIEKHLAGFSLRVDIFSKLYYVFFLKTRLREKKMNFKIFEPFLYLDGTESPNFHSYGESILFSYRWKPTKQAYLKPIYERIKSKIVNPNYENFKKIFSGVNTNEITALKITLTAAELLYFFQILMDSGYINSSGSFSYEKLIRCFVTENGLQFNLKSLKSVKSQLKKDDSDNTFTILSHKKKKEIENIIYAENSHS